MWLYPVGAVFVMVSALIPPVPSTTVFVALGALAGLDGGPKAWALVLAMIAGAVAGDLATYGATRLFGQSRWGATRGPRRQRAVDAATRRLRKSPFTLMLTSRFVPLGRLSTNIACTVAGYRLRAFTGFSLASAAVWSAYSVGVGICTRFWPGLSTQAAVLAAIAVSIVLGWLLGKASTWILDHRAAPAPAGVE
ncbi:hypothetical protein AL755_05330 [Arthrobacter sp. ERGS1:01]|nr:hypothetical protein AL755_05330 [Arthrobacter sp. ERGS1:01]